ncbi:hypothetical protein BOX15_Mlig026277g1, partial [Macrostomum lignano]
HYLSEHPRALKRQNQPVNSKHLSLFNKQTEYYSIASIMKFQLALPIVALVLISTALICSAAWIRPRSAAAYGPRSAAPLRGPRSAAPLRGPRSAAPLRGPRSADMDDDSEPDNNVLCCGAIPNQGPSEDSYSNYVEESVDFQAPAKRGPENMLMRKFICDYYRHHNWKPPAYLKCHQM